MRLETLAVHAGRRVDPTTGAVAPPIHLSTTFERDPDGSYSRGHLYARNSNPTREALEACLAALEGGAAAAAFASGSAATAAVFQALSPGDHVVAPHDAYHGTGRLLRETFTRWGLATTFADMTNPAEVQRALRPTTRVVWVETPSNPMWKVSDIRALAALAHDAGARCVCDNTVATPVGQSPLELGADLIVHATTKYLGGHGDLMGGAVIARVADDMLERVRAVQASGGGIPSPFDCWLVLRGIQTLPWRVRAHGENALKLARFLAEHRRVEAVHYPGLPSHPAHALAARQMRCFSGMLSFQVRGSAAEALGVAAKVRVFTRATSFGGTDSLIEHRASVEGPNSRTPDNLLRVSVGLEHADDLIADLEEALS
ncbi:MAG: aminotransferase class V-fold PLP-dependent enzyme [Candidatus Rokubacteria bacterium]|nr:aminotransferase class V-fold PLP-dependent enzyme [Candidatus Rokubacteria bacterium]